MSEAWTPILIIAAFASGASLGWFYGYTHGRRMLRLEQMNERLRKHIVFDRPT